MRDLLLERHQSTLPLVKVGVRRQYELESHLHLGCANLKKLNETA